MRFRSWAIFGALVLTGMGCASQTASRPQADQSANETQPQTTATTAPSTQPLDPIALMTLDQIEPVPKLPASQPSTAPSKPPLEAIELYAKARDARNQRQRNTAINLIEKALELDPDSFELNFALGRAYLEANGSMDRALAALGRAAGINPNSIDVQFELGRVYQVRSDTPRAIEQFRLARLTDDYRQGDVLAAVVDYRLAVLLEQQGYTRAALQCFRNLQYRLEHPSSASRMAPEIAFLMARPESLHEAMGMLYEKLGDTAEALESYRRVADRAPNDFDAQARVVKMLARLDRRADATAAAAELVKRFHASPASLELMRTVWRDFHSEEAFVQQLAKLHAEQPGDRAILFALADTLAASEQLDRARDLLKAAIAQRNGDVEIVERLYKLYAERDRVTDAAQLIIEVTAAYPDTTTELVPLFADLVRYSRKNSLRGQTVGQIVVTPDEVAARQYWVWAASRQSRASAARAALEQSAHASRPFDPACRALIDTYYGRSDLDDTQRLRSTEALIDAVKKSGRDDLAAELRGILALHQEKIDEATHWFAEALRLSRRPAPDLLLNYAVCLLRQGNSPRFEQLMWKLLSDRPRFDQGYALLLNYYRGRNDLSRAWDLVDRWLTADPSSISARAARCGALVEQRHLEEGLASMRRLFEQHPDDENVVDQYLEFQVAAGLLQQAIDALEAERAAHPGNRAVIEALLKVYVARKETAKATRVLDAARAAVTDDPDMLYYVAHLYERVDQRQTTEIVLGDVLKIDPRHAPSGNDLGYTLADEGKELDRAESLIRMAVEVEPDNTSYLDSLGWVLYKRGKFDDARKLLEQACEPLDSADPVVLDHLADTLYRLDRRDEARQMWQRTKQRLSTGGNREDLTELKPKLDAKLKQLDESQPVDVAPVVESAQNKTQAQK
jgi:tetratricopeptide (TPR) repeat protein